MPQKYRVALSDGRRFDVETDGGPPSEADVMAQLGGAPSSAKPGVGALGLTARPPAGDVPAGDLGATFTANGRPVREEAVADTPSGPAVGRFAAGAWRNLNPITALETMGNAVLHPIDTIKGIGQAQGEVARQAKAAFAKGDTLTGVRHSAEYLLPVIGPMLAKAGNRAASGDVAGGLGEGAGLGLSLVGPKAAGELLPSKVRVPIPLKNRNPVERAAVDFGRKRGIPVDAATASGNMFVRGTQALSDRTIGGSLVAQKAAQAQAEAFARVGGDLANEVHPRAVSPEMAGQAMRESVEGKVRDFHGQANEAYTRLRDIEAQPGVRREVEVPTEITTAADEAAAVRAEAAPGTRFASHDAPVDEVFEGAWQDARRNGYTGTKKGLREKFEQELQGAHDEAADVESLGADYRPSALFEAIRDAGGIGSDAVYGGELGRLWQSSSGTVVQRGFTKGGRLKSAKTLPTGGFGGVTNVLRKTGKSLDTIAESLRQDPRFSHIDGPNTLLDELDNAISGLSAKQQQKLLGGLTLEDALSRRGVQPGERWWDASGGSASFDPAALEQAPKTTTVEMQLPVNLREAKAALRPIYDRMMRQLPVTQQRSSPGLKAIQNILDGPDFAPLSQTDMDLGTIKGISRGADLPELRDMSQGLAAGAVKRLDEAVRKAAAGAGPEALEALETGRSATTQKYAASDVLKQLRTEPVQTFDQAVWQKDAGIDRLRSVAKLAPDSMRKVGRAYLDQLLSTATAEGAFDKAKGLAAKWQELGPETKKLLFPDARHVENLDSFFTLAKKAAENPNPSGTAYVGSILAQGGLVFVDPVTGVALQVGGAALSKLLRSPTAVKALTRGLEVPLKNRGAAVATYGQIAQLVGSGRPAPPIPIRSETEAGPGSGAVRR